MKFHGKIISGTSSLNSEYKYQVLENILDFKREKCIFVKSLNPDYSILLNKIDLIISETGAELSHLAIISREYDKTILIIPNIINKISKKGKVKIDIKNKNAKIEIIK